MMRVRQASLLVVAVLLFYQGQGFASYPKSDHYDGKKFYNSWSPLDKSFFDFLKWQWTRVVDRWPSWVDDNVTSSFPQSAAEGEFAMTFVNHATHLIQMDHVNFLTDPIFSERASPVSWAGPKRSRGSGVAIEALPVIDFVVISHNHYDHLDEKSIQALVEKRDPLFLVPLGNAKLLKSFGVKKVVELDWWEHYTVPSKNVEVHLVPAQHWSARGIFDRNEALWGGFVIQSAARKVFFAGDTGYGPHFKKIKDRFGKIDVNILPIGAYEPRWFMKEQHMNPEDAVNAHMDLESPLSFGTHYGTFQLTDEGIGTPIKELSGALLKHSIDTKNFRTLRNGETYSTLK